MPTYPNLAIFLHLYPAYLRHRRACRFESAAAAYRLIQPAGCNGIILLFTIAPSLGHTVSRDHVLMRCPSGRSARSLTPPPGSKSGNGLCLKLERGLVVFLCSAETMAHRPQGRGVRPGVRPRQRPRSGAALGVAAVERRPAGGGTALPAGGERAVARGGGAERAGRDHLPHRGRDLPVPVQSEGRGDSNLVCWLRCFLATRCTRVVD